MPLQATSGAASYDAFGGGVAAVPNYIESVFQTYLYTGTGASQTITNGIDLSTKGGLTWIKGRSGATGHRLTDTARGVTKSLASETTAAETTETTGLTAFGTTGFTIGADADYNTSAATYASWTFRKQPKFFDVVTYTGDGNSGRSISHNLGSTPGCVIIKRTDTTSNWITWHRGATSVTYPYLKLNTTAAVDSYSESLTPTSTTFIAGSSGASLDDMNASGGSYVAYVFAHNAGGFGLTGTDNVISCGTYSTDPNKLFGTVELGFEPQWILSKATGTGAWFLQDMMRGDPVGGPVQNLLPNTSGTEVTRSANDASNGVAWPTPTGFSGTAPANSTFIYIAIRRGPMKVPTSGTSVFSPNTYTTNASTPTTVTTNFPVDLNLYKFRTQTYGTYASDRLRGTTTASSNFMITSSTNAEGAGSQGWGIDSNTGYVDAWAYQFIGTAENVVSWNFRRAPSFFDEVCYTGTGSATTQTHNLQAVPELIIVKKRNVDSTTNWYVYSAATGNTQVGVLSGTNAFFTNSSYWNNTTPTSSVFSLGTGSNVNQSGTLFVSYLFATAAGVSKVGSYTGTATTKQIDCGFTAGARFVLIKRTDQTSDWYVWDTARGIVSGNDPYLLLNSTAAEVTSTDYIDTYSAGFELSSTAPAAINTSGGSFIFLAIA